ncbi:23287_t:CDS:2 [Cetraspora pellucida]|uniref:23287_t:CDS:1 n=1 Tax=Cetraspora pellucida TaxID=1433469 RepID=A0A9N9N377_9GLOM|nr:23287_t:CDS:2 [Cetraspora pellucida]
MDCETHNLYFYQTSTFALQLPLIAVQELTVKKIILILNLLEQFKFRLDIKDQHEGRTVFLEACSRLMKRDKQYAAEFPTLVDWFLYSMKFNVNERDNEGWTSLHFIMELKHEEFIIPTLKKLLQHGADPTIEERNGYNPLGYAVYKHELRFIRRLMENIPEFQNDNIIKRAISKTAVFIELLADVMNVWSIDPNCSDTSVVPPIDTKQAVPFFEEDFKRFIASTIGARALSQSFVI